MATNLLAPEQATSADRGVLGDDLCWLLARASHALLREFTAALEGHGISPRAHAVLVGAGTGKHTQTELARSVGLDKTTMVVTIDELEASGLAERVPSPSDRRARVIKVTPAGRRKVKEANAILGNVRAEVLGDLEDAERETFLRALGKLTSGRLSAPVACTQSVRRRI